MNKYKLIVFAFLWLVITTMGMGVANATDEGFQVTSGDIDKVNMLFSDFKYTGAGSEEEVVNADNLAIDSRTYERNMRREKEATALVYDIMLVVCSDLEGTGLFNNIQESTLEQFVKTNKKKQQQLLIQQEGARKLKEEENLWKNYQESTAESSSVVLDNATVLLGEDAESAKQKEEMLKNAPYIYSNGSPNFEKFDAVGIGAVVTGEFELRDDNKIELRVKLWDILDGKRSLGKYYVAYTKNWRAMAHDIANDIYTNITGEKTGNFDSKIVYVSESGGIRDRVKKITVMDFDGENNTKLTNGKNLVLTPVFSADGRKVFYLQYADDNRVPQIYSMDLDGLSKKRVGNFYEMTYAPARHPTDNNILLFSASVEGGNSDIYEINLATQKVLRLTNNPGIDTTPVYSPDGNKIIFVSDRNGKKELYSLDRRSNRISKISFGNGEYHKPACSPDGRLIAFTKISKGKFYIGLMSYDGQNERLLTGSYLIEGVKWSPNSRYVLYSKQSGPYGKASIPSIYVLDILTGFERRLPTPLNRGATDPDWIK